MGEIPLPDPPLRDATVVLRAWSAADVPGILAGFADPCTLRFNWPVTRAYTETDAREFLVDQERARRAGRELSLALTAPGAPDQVVGGASIGGIDPEAGRAHVGYWVAPPARGRGVATQATRLIAAWAFATLPIERLELTCQPDNLASARVAVKAGFTHEGVLRSHAWHRDRRRDTVMFSLLRSELPGAVLPGTGPPGAVPPGAGPPGTGEPPCG